MGWSASARRLPRASLTLLVVLSAACGSDDPKGNGIIENDAGAGATADTIPPPPAKMDAGAPVLRLDSGGPSFSGSQDGGPAVSTVPVGSQGPGTVTTDQGSTGGPRSGDGGVPAVVTPLPSDGNRQSVCYNDKPCAKDLFCFAPTGGTVQYPGVCVDGCRTDANCPAIDGIAQVCSTDGQCHVDCGGAMNKGDAPCPAHEVCRDVRPNPFAASAWRCTYPDSSGSRTAPTYGPCSTQHAGGDCTGTNTCHVPSAGGLTLPTTRVGTAGYCTSECAMAMDCMVPAGTTAMPICAGSRCEFDCSAAGANTCPDKMNCRDIGNNPIAPAYRCVFLE